MRVRFGDVLFDGEARQVFRGADTLHLRGKAFELLRILIHERPRAVSKAELQEHLWPDTYVSETNLPSLITEIRETLSDSAHEPRYIATVHGFGYAFRAIATIESVDPAPAGCWLATNGAPIPLIAGENVLGRVGPGAILDSPTVSRRHALIVVAGQAATIEDLGSKNGTFVNDDAVTSSRALKDGDRIRVGSFLLTFRLAALNAPTLTEPAS